MEFHLYSAIYRIRRGRNIVLLEILRVVSVTPVLSYHLLLLLAFVAIFFSNISSYPLTRLPFPPTNPPPSLHSDHITRQNHSTRSPMTISCHPWQRYVMTHLLINRSIPATSHSATIIFPTVSAACKYAQDEYSVCLFVNLKDDTPEGSNYRASCIIIMGVKTYVYWNVGVRVYQSPGGVCYVTRRISCLCNISSYNRS